MMEHGAEKVQKYYVKTGTISPIGENVANLLDDIFGIHHIDQSALQKVDWTNQYYIRIALYGGLYLYDDDKLTQLVVLCHDRCLRLEINPCNFHHLELLFHQRDRIADFYHRMPTMEKHLEYIRQHYERVY